MMNSQDFSLNNNETKDFLNKYLKKWKWFLLSLLLFVALAYIYNRYATPKYEVLSKIQILEEKGASPELAVFKELDFFGGKQSEVEDEIEVLNSRSNFIQVVKKLKINIKYEQIGDIKQSEIYTDKPININFLVQDSILYEADFSFYLKLNSEETFDFKVKEEDVYKTNSYGKSIKIRAGEMVITPVAEYFNIYKGEEVFVKIMPVYEVAQQYKENVSITNMDEFSKIVTLSLKDPIPEKGIDILNALTNVYNNNAIVDKKTIADRTFKFINERISVIYSSLSTVDSSAQNFKTSRGLTDIASQTNINLNVGASNQQDLQNAETQLNIASSMKDIIDNQGGYDVLPSNIGLSDASIANTTANYNRLVQERKRLLKSSNEKNPMIVNIDQQLQGLKQGMRASLTNMADNLSLTVNNLSSQQSRINSRIYSAPKNERALRDITRKQQTTESLYLYLLQRREESQVALASTAPKSKIIDAAYVENKNPISPNKPKVYIALGILGLLLPFTLFYLADLLDNKIHSKSSLENKVKNIPVLAELPRIGKKEKMILGDDDRSVLAESLRILRTNLDYLIKTNKSETKKSNIILITSSVSGEGKTFISSNLAMIFASTNKKVLLIGADIRNPKIHQFFNGKNIDKFNDNKDKSSLGLSEYLLDKTVVSDDLINSMLVYNNTVDIIYSGKLLPNPSELLMSDRINDLLAEMSEKYDYVIVDSAPLMLVTDTLLISPYVDHTIYVTRAGVTEVNVVEFPIGLNKEGKLKGLTFVVNDVRENNLGYGGKYGYGYGIVEKKWWQFS